jgi:acetyl esterase/lipase
LANPEITAIREMLAASPANMTIDELRQMYDGLGGQFPTAADVTVTSTTVNGVPAEWTVSPAAADDKVVLYLHGGGYVIGSILSHRHLASEIGRAAGTKSLAIDYRLAPEHPFPAAVDDALAAYRYLLEAGYKPGNIAISGDSAGGGLTVATLLAAKAAGLPQPACGFCISPWVDLEAVGGSMKSKSAEDPMVQYEALAAWAGLYLNGADARTPLAAPMYGDLTGLAPLLIHVGSAETLLDDSVRLAGIAGAAEVPVQMEVWPEMIHVWHFMHPILGDARKALAGAGDFIRARMG